MIKKCKGCGRDFDGPSNKLFHDPKCKKRWENAQRSAPKQGAEGGRRKPHQPPSEPVNRPQHLNEVAAAYWDRIAPTVIKRGHLNEISLDAFAELCDIYSRLVEVNKAIDENNRSLLQIVEQWDNKNGVESQQFKESALSDLKRKYSKLFLDYQKQFYLTPLSNRGNFGLEEEPEKPKASDVWA